MDKYGLVWKKSSHDIHTVADAVNYFQSMANTVSDSIWYSVVRKKRSIISVSNAAEESTRYSYAQTWHIQALLPQKSTHGTYFVTIQYYGNNYNIDI